MVFVLPSDIQSSPPLSISLVLVSHYRVPDMPMMINRHHMVFLDYAGQSVVLVVLERRRRHRFLSQSSNCGFVPFACDTINHEPLQKSPRPPFSLSGHSSGVQEAEEEVVSLVDFYFCCCSE